MKKYNISKPKKYISKGGVEKTFWQNIGTMTEFDKPDGSISRIIEIPAIGLEANIFAIEPKQPPTEQSQNATIEPVIQTEEIINPDDIPF
jgi:hypothetical protein